jgi:hypothetical protein
LISEGVTLAIWVAGGVIDVRTGSVEPWRIRFVARGVRVESWRVMASGIVHIQRRRIGIRGKDVLGSVDTQPGISTYVGPGRGIEWRRGTRIPTGVKPACRTTYTAAASGSAARSRSPPRGGLASVGGLGLGVEKAELKCAGTSKENRYPCETPVIDA